MITGAGLSLASTDYSQLISDLGSFMGRLANLDADQLEQAVSINEAMAENFFQGLSDSEKDALKDTLDIDHDTYLNISNGLFDPVTGYIFEYASPEAGDTGYQGLLNAIDPDSPDLVYLNGLIQKLYQSVGDETRSQLASKRISFEEFVWFLVKMSQIQFEPGLVITDDVLDQIDDILDWLIDKSDGNLTRDDLTACGLTAENLTGLFGQLTEDQKDQLLDILAAMGLIIDIPQVETQTPDGFSTSGATLKGSIISNGGRTINSYGFDWGTSEGSLTNHVEVGTSDPVSLPFDFNFDLTGLSCGNTYYFKAYASNDVGTSANTEVKNFNTNNCEGEVVAPAVETVDADSSSITKTSATIKGTITNNGGGTINSYGFDWGTSEGSLTNHVEVGTSNPGSLPFDFEFNMTGLACNTPYFFKAYASNDFGTSANTDVKSFTTLACTEPEPPIITGHQPIGEDVPPNAEVKVTFDRPVTEGDLINTVEILQGGNTLTGVSAHIDIEDPNTLIIDHPDDFQFGQTYTVSIPVDCVQSDGVGNTSFDWDFIVRDKYNLTLDVQYDGDNNTVTMSGFMKEWESDIPIGYVSVGIVIEKAGVPCALAETLTGPDGYYEWTFSTTGFEAGTYDVTATVNQADRQGSFIIPSGEVVAPTVQTVDADSSSITKTSATLKGTITGDGGGTINSYGFDWGTSETSLTHHVVVGTSVSGSLPFDFSINVAEFACSNTYFFKAYASNEIGTSANNDAKYFTTDDCEIPVTAPTVTTSDATDLKSTGATLNGNITSTGGENCERKFQYRKQGDTAWNDAGYVTGTFGAGAFSCTLTGLNSKTTYEYKAMARNSANSADEWSEGSTVTFTTKSSGGGGGGGGGGTPELNVDTYKPAADAQNVALDAVVKVTFKQDIAAVDLTKVGIKDAQNKVVGGVTAAVDGKALVIAHDKFAYNTKYTVSVPKGTVKRTDRTVENSNLEWSFTTAVETLTACAYTDVPENHWAAGVIKELCQKGILDGYPDGTFRPGNDITRAEFVKIMVVALGLAEENPATPIFKDVNPNDWYYGEVEAAAKANLVNGYRNGLFKPDAKITRQEIAVILIRALGKTDEAAANANTKTAFKDDHNIASWARGSVVVAVNEGLIKGYPNGTLGPKKNATRAEVCTLVSCFLTKSQ
jgi:hypothetical protein